MVVTGPVGVTRNRVSCGVAGLGAKVDVGVDRLFDLNQLGSVDLVEHDMLYCHSPWSDAGRPGIESESIDATSRKPSSDSPRLFKKDWRCSRFCQRSTGGEARNACADDADSQAASDAPRSDWTKAAHSIPLRIAPSMLEFSVNSPAQ